MPSTTLDRALNSLHLAGSIASVTGLSLLTANKTLATTGPAELLGYVAGAAFVVGSTMLFIRAVQSAFSWVNKRIGVYWALGTSLLWIPIALWYFCALELFAFQAFTVFFGMLATVGV